MQLRLDVPVHSHQQVRRRLNRDRKVGFFHRIISFCRIILRGCRGGSGDELNDFVGLFDKTSIEEFESANVVFDLLSEAQHLPDNT